MEKPRIISNYIRTVLVIIIMSILAAGCSNNSFLNIKTLPQTDIKGIIDDNISVNRGMVYTMKGVGIDLPQSDFNEMKEAGITILGTEWGMEESVIKARSFLDKAAKAGLKVVMDGGFSYTAWGFSDGDWDDLPRGKHPVWQKERVQNWIKALKDHPAIYAWDISNEFGENLPSGAGVSGSDWPKGRLTIEQLKQARADVLEVDSTRPIHVRMYGWDVGKMQSYYKDVLSCHVADIISLNLYSNYLDRGKLEWPDVIQDAGQYYVDNIQQLSPGTVIWLSVAAFEYPQTFQRPTVAELKRDLRYTTLIDNLDGISYFCWGPVNQWDETCNWYLPVSGAEIWDIIKSYMKDPAQFIKK